MKLGSTIKYKGRTRAGAATKKWCSRRRTAAAPAARPPPSAHEPREGHTAAAVLEAPAVGEHSLQEPRPHAERRGQQLLEPRGANLFCASVLGLVLLTFKVFGKTCWFCAKSSLAKIVCGNFCCKQGLATSCLAPGRAPRRAPRPRRGARAPRRRGSCSSPRAAPRPLRRRAAAPRAWGGTFPGWQQR